MKSPTEQPAGGDCMHRVQASILAPEFPALLPAQWPEFTSQTGNLIGGQFRDFRARGHDPKKCTKPIQRFGGFVATAIRKNT